MKKYSMTIIPGKIKARDEGKRMWNLYVTLSAQNQKMGDRNGNSTVDVLQVQSIFGTYCNFQ